MDDKDQSIKYCVQTTQHHCSKVTVNFNIHLKNPISTKTNYKEIHKGNIQRSAVAKTLMTDTTQKYGVVIIKPEQLKHQDELQHLPWPSDLNIIKPLLAVLERGVRCKH